MVRRFLIASVFVSYAVDCILAHGSYHDDRYSGSSDDMDREMIARRSERQKEWQYDGIPIEIPFRRSGSENKITTTVTITASDATASDAYLWDEPCAMFSIIFVHGTWVPCCTPRTFDPLHRAVCWNTGGDVSPCEWDITCRSCGGAATDEPQLDRRYRRIYNADEVASIEDYPFLAALLINKKLWCGGAVISSDKILTAAHCLQLQYNNRFFREYVKMLSVRLGSSNSSSGGELFSVTEIFFHPNYKPDTLEFNFAVLKLQKNISHENDNIITEINYSKNKNVATESKITFLGWGSVLGIGGSGGQVLLQKLELPVYDIADCQEIYGRELVTRSNFCAGFITVAKNVCNHDAGGPAIMNGVLVGILSFSSKRCDIPDKPAVFSSVGYVAPWLDTLGENNIKITNTALKAP